MRETGLTLSGIRMDEPVAKDCSARDARVRSLVDAHYEFVWRALRRLGMQQGDVDDGVQKVLLIATTKLDAIRAGSERSFLFQTAVRVASDYRRSRRRRPEVSDAGVEEPFDEAPGAEELLDMRAARETLDEVLDRMSLELRAVFVLFELEQMTVTEIAALLSVPRGTVASRLRRAKSFFRESVARSANANTSEDGDE